MLCCSPAARAAQEQRERVPLLAGQRRSGIGQPGDVGIQAGLAVIIVGVPVVARAFVVAGCARPGAGLTRLVPEGLSGCPSGSSFPAPACHGDAGPLA